MHEESFLCFNQCHEITDTHLAQFHYLSAKWINHQSSFLIPELTLLLYPPFPPALIILLSFWPHQADAEISWEDWLMSCTQQNPAWGEHQTCLGSMLDTSDPAPQICFCFWLFTGRGGRRREKKEGGEGGEDGRDGRVGKQIPEDPVSCPQLQGDRTVGVIK